MDRGRVFISLRKPVILFGNAERRMMNPSFIISTFALPKGLGFATQDHSWCAFVGETTALCHELHNARTRSDSDSL